MADMEAKFPLYYAYSTELNVLIYGTSKGVL